MESTPPMYYAELPARPGLQLWVAAHWHFRVAVDAGEIRHTVPLTGGVLFHVHNRAPGVPILTGPRLAPLQTTVRGGDEFWGSQLWPGAAGALLGPATLSGYVSSLKQPRGAQLMTQATGLVSLLTIALLGVLEANSAPAQEAPDEDPARESLEAMRALPDLVGRWEGGGWMRQGPAEPSDFSSVEIVESRLDGQLLTVEGIHHSKEDPERLVFHAFAVLSWDRDKDAYNFRTYTNAGQGGDFEARVEDGAFIWGREVPHGQIRYTIRVTEDRWDEVGEFSPDGKSWNQFFEMKVRRTSR